MYAVALLAEALCWKPKGRWFNFHYLVGVLSWPNSSSLGPRALGSDRPLTEMSTRTLTGDEGRSAHKANLTPISVSILYKMWEHRRLEILLCCRDSLTFFAFVFLHINISYILPSFHKDNAAALTELLLPYKWHKFICFDLSLCTCFLFSFTSSHFVIGARCVE